MRFRAILFIFLFSPIVLQASQTEFKNYRHLQDLSAGKISGVCVSNCGEISLAPRMSKIAATSRPFLWNAVADGKGNVFAASGDGAVLLKISSTGKIDTIFQQQQSEIFALARNRKGELFMALSPEGKIYRIDSEGSAKLFAQLKQTYVWDLIFNEKNECFAATGDSGVIYKISPRGTVSEFYRCADVHARTLVFDKSGNLLIGTSNQGYIYQVNTQGEGYVLRDCDYEEIRQIEVAEDGTIYALAVSRKEAAAPKKLPGSNKSETSSIQISDLSFNSNSSKQSLRTAIISISKGGFVRNFWQPPASEAIYSIKYSDGRLLAGTGESGKLYSIDCADADNFSQIVQVAEQQISSVIKLNRQELILGTSNLLALYRLRSKTGQRGSFESPVFDATAISQWGEIQWEKTGVVETAFFTRSGNTEKPTQTWSPWKKVAKIGEGRGSIVSPSARFLQWKLMIKEKHHRPTNNVHNVQISYRQKNFPPQIADLIVQPLSKRKSSTAKKTTSSMIMDLNEMDALESSLSKQIASGPAMLAKRNGYFQISWKASDPNHDQLVFQIRLRHEKEKSFWTIKKDLKKNRFTWDSRSVPDGKYQIELIASDKPQNPINSAKESRRISDWFVVDHTPPLVENIRLVKTKAHNLKLHFIVRDGMSAIREAFISVNAGEWQWLNSKDGVSDSREEIFEISLSQSTGEIHSLVIKALDEAENIGYGRLLIEE